MNDATTPLVKPGAGPERRPARVAANYLWVGLVAAGWLVFFWAILAIPVLGDHTPPGSQVAAVLLGVLILLVLLLVGERPHWPAAARWWMFGGGGGLIALAFLLNLGAPQWRGLLALGLMAVALPAGYWVGDRLEKLSNLIPVAVAFACADIFSVFQGPSKAVVDDLAKHQMAVETARIDAAANLPPELARQAAEQAAAAIRAPLADYVVVHMPMPGTGSSVPVLGIGDFIIVALLFRAAWLYGLNPLAIAVSSLASIAVALAVSSLLDAAIPALPFIAVGVVGYLAVVNPRVRRLSRYELVLSAAIVLIFAALIAARWVYALL
jgi:hypothetical protein